MGYNQATSNAALLAQETGYTLRIVNNTSPGREPSSRLGRTINPPDEPPGKIGYRFPYLDPENRRISINAST